MATKKSILFLVTDYQGCGWYRCHVPGVALKKLGYEVILDDKAYVEYLNSDVVVISRPCTEKHLEAIRYVNSRGKLSIADVDDNMWDVKPSNHAYKFWSKPKNVAFFNACLKEVQMITTPSQHLGKLLGQRNRNIKIIPNMLPDDFWPNIDRDYSPPVIKLGWAGGTSHFEDLEMVVSPVKQVVEEFKNVELHLFGNFKMMGNPFEGFPAVLYDIATLENYPSVIRQFDIGFIPLENNNFNNFKSDLKFVEYAAAKLPVIISNTPVYELRVTHNETGLFANNDKDWIKGLKRLINDAGLREKLGENARKYAEKRMIGVNINLWEKIYGLAK